MFTDSHKYVKVLKNGMNRFISNLWQLLLLERVKVRKGMGWKVLFKKDLANFMYNFFHKNSHMILIICMLGANFLSVYHLLYLCLLATFIAQNFPLILRSQFLDVSLMIFFFFFFGVAEEKVLSSKFSMIF